jgi:hypothetical protein
MQYVVNCGHRVAQSIAVNVIVSPGFGDKPILKIVHAQLAGIQSGNFIRKSLDTKHGHFGQFHYTGLPGTFVQAL